MAPRRLCLLALGTLACVSGRSVIPVAPVRTLRKATLEEVLAAHEGYCRALETISASGDLDVRDLRAGKSQKLGVKVVASRGGRLYLKGSVAVVTALEVVSDGERFWFQVPSKKKIWTGKAGGAPRREADQPAYYALRPRDLIAALLPEPLAAEGDTLMLESDAGAFSLAAARLENARGTARRRVWLDRESLLPTRSRTFDAAGDLLLETSFGAWQDGSPRSVVVRRPADGYEATFSLTKIARNPPVPPKVFVPRLAEGYEVVEVPE